MAGLLEARRILLLQDLLFVGLGSASRLQLTIELALLRVAALTASTWRHVRARLVGNSF